MEIKPLMLVVDDEPLVRMDLVDAAEKTGFETIQASSAGEAVKILESRSDIRVVITDIRMPGDMDGLALSHVIRDRWPPTVIVICSGNTRPRPEELPTDVAFFAKPCSGPEIEAVVSEIFGKLSREVS